MSTISHLLKVISGFAPEAWMQLQLTSVYSNASKRRSKCVGGRTLFMEIQIQQIWVIRKRDSRQRGFTHTFCFWRSRRRFGCFALLAFLKQNIYIVEWALNKSETLSSDVKHTFDFAFSRLSSIFCFSISTSSFVPLTTIISSSSNGSPHWIHKKRVT